MTSDVGLLPGGEQKCTSGIHPAEYIFY